jgi:hypothetical protein
VLVIRAFLSGEVEPNTQNLLHKGRPFILRRLTGQWDQGQFHFSGKRVNQDL